MAEALVLHVGNQAALVEVVEFHGCQPGAQQGACVLWVEVVASGSMACVALAQKALHHEHHGAGVRSRTCLSLVRVIA